MKFDRLNIPICFKFSKTVKIGIIFSLLLFYRFHFNFFLHFFAFAENFLVVFLYQFFFIFDICVVYFVEIRWDFRTCCLVEIGCPNVIKDAHLYQLISCFPLTWIKFKHFSQDLPQFMTRFLELVINLASVHFAL